MHTSHFKASSVHFFLMSFKHTSEAKQGVLTLIPAMLQYVLYHPALEDLHSDLTITTTTMAQITPIMIIILQFFHQYFLLSFAALLSNTEAPA